MQTSRINPYQDMRWKTIDKLCRKKLGLPRYICKGMVGDGPLVKRRLIGWELNIPKFNAGEFYHVFGVPGIFFSGFLPTEEWASKSAPAGEIPSEDVSDFEFEVKNMEMFYDILRDIKRLVWDEKELELHVRSET